MLVAFESKDPDCTQLEDVAVRRAHFVMRRLTWLVPTVTVKFGHARTAGTDAFKLCTVELQTHAAGTLTATSTAGDGRLALESALAGAARALVRATRQDSEARRTSGARR